MPLSLPLAHLPSSAPWLPLQMLPSSERTDTKQGEASCPHLAGLPSMAGIIPFTKILKLSGGVYWSHIIRKWLKQYLNQVPPTPKPLCFTHCLLPIAPLSFWMHTSACSCPCPSAYPSPCSSPCHSAFPPETEELLLVLLRALE